MPCEQMAGDVFVLTITRRRIHRLEVAGGKRCVSGEKMSTGISIVLLGGRQDGSL